MTTTVVRGSGIFVPDGVVTNSRMSRLMDTTDDWIRQRTGIEERRLARSGTSSADLGFEAGASKANSPFLYSTRTTCPGLKAPSSSLSASGF